MPPKKAPKGHVVQSSSATKPIQSFNVLASGSRRGTIIRETASSRVKRLDDVIPPENLLILNQQISEDWPDEERPAIHPAAHDDQPTSVVAELEHLMDDAHDMPVQELHRGKVFISRRPVLFLDITQQGYRDKTRC
ncbi:hypothetical protein FRC08_000987 [Ceratobasidium sp. 394]|nr:hypothetical protein FRC08_000987 [Ceratobasidium sp. 394]